MSRETTQPLRSGNNSDRGPTRLGNVFLQFLVSTLALPKPRHSPVCRNGKENGAISLLLRYWVGIYRDDCVDSWEVIDTGPTHSNEKHCIWFRRLNTMWKSSVPDPTPSYTTLAPTSLPIPLPRFCCISQSCGKCQSLHWDLGCTAWGATCGITAWMCLSHPNTLRWKYSSVSFIVNGELILLTCKQPMARWEVDRAASSISPVRRGYLQN